MIAEYLQGTNGVPPRLVGIVRGALEAAALAGLAFIGMNLDEIVSFFPALPHVSGSAITSGSVGYFLIRWLESEADQVIDPSQNRINPPNLTGRD